MGGPIVKDKILFFVTPECQREAFPAWTFSWVTGPGRTSPAVATTLKRVLDIVQGNTGGKVELWVGR